MTTNNSAPSYLIIGPSWVGDMVMSQVLFKLLKQQNPDTRIDVLAPAWSAPILERMPEVHQSITMPLGHGEFKLSVRRAIGHDLRQAHYDRSIVIPNSFKSALIPWFARIPVRTGYHREGRGLILSDARTLNKQKHPLMIERLLALGSPKSTELTKPYPVPKFEVETNNVEQALQKHGLNTGKPILALCPGAEFGPSKRWPETHYADVANHWLKQGGQVWLFGSKNDQPVAADIQNLTQQQCHDLTGKTSLAEAIDCLSCASAIVSNDSGLMHIAAALDKPMVAVYGSTSPGFTPPLSDKAKIVRLGLECSPCFKRECPLGHLNCLKQLDAQRVITTLEGLM